MVFLLIGVFALSLLVAIRASSSFTRRLEVLSDLFEFSPGLLSLLGALGANIPNYVAALSAAVSGQIEIGIGIIIGSNIYNIAVILAVTLLAAPSRQGVTLSRQSAGDTRQVGRWTLAMMISTTLAVTCFYWRSSTHPAHLAVPIALPVLNLVTLGLFAGLTVHALGRVPETTVSLVPSVSSNGQATVQDSHASAELAPGTVRTLPILGQALLALLVALVGVVIMVQTGEAAAVVMHLPPAILSLIVLAIATSMPNTVVAFTLIRTQRSSASLEEIFSSNSVNAAFGIAVPLLFWASDHATADPILVGLDGPLMVALTAVAVLAIGREHLSRWLGLFFLLVYAGWIVVHLML